jgi:hypothetical protein
VTETAAPSDEAGQTTAEGGTSIENGESINELVGENNENASNAAQTGSIVDGLASWDNVRTIPSGLAHFKGTGSFDLTSCGGSACTNNNTGSSSLTLNIDFGNRTYGGNCGGSCGSSSFSAFDSDTTNNAFASTSGSIGLTSFSSLTGDAIINATGSNSTAQIQLINAGGEAAKSATVTINYSDGSSNTASGSITAPRIEGGAPIEG